MPFFRYHLLALGATLPVAALFSEARAQSLPSVGAPRVLVITDETGRELRGDFSGVAWEKGGNGFYFTLETGKTRNIWRARPDSLSTARFASWRARAITQLQTPFFAFNAAALDDGAIVCLSNALADDEKARVCRFDFGTQTLRSLFQDNAPHGELSVSPDAKLLSFTARENEIPTIFGARLGNANSPITAPFPLAFPARRSAWLDSQTLVFDSLGAPRGLVSRRISEPRARLLLTGGGESSGLGGGVGLVLSARPSKSSPPQLYLLAKDGSGLRALGSTEGARRPAIAGNGKFLAFDAPFEGARRIWLAPVEGGAPLWKTPNAPRRAVLNRRVTVNPRRPGSRLQSETFVNASVVAPSVLPPPVPDLNRLAPIAFIQGVEPRQSAQVSASGPEKAVRSLLVRGTTGGETPIQVVLEWGAGENPRVWQRLPVSQSPTNGGPLALWMPPNTRGVFTLRLSVSARGGATQSLYRVRLPLGESNSNQTSAGAIRETQTIGREPLPPLPLPPPAPFPPNVPRPSPTSRPIPRPTSTPRPLPPKPAPPRPTPTPIPFPTSIPFPTPVPTPSAPQPTPTSVPPPTTFAPPLTFVAKFNVSGTLARVAPGQKFGATLWAQNLGTATWNSDNSAQNQGESTRFVARWVDFSTGTRRKWNFFWLRTPVAPGNRTRQFLNLTAPSRPGKYKLIYGLVRVPKGGSWNAPPYNAPQEAWPGEFGAIAFAVEVATVIVGEGEEN